MAARAKSSGIDALLAEANRRASHRLTVPRSFVDFCAWVAIDLRPCQRVYCMVAYDRVQPSALRGEDREIADVLFGGVAVIPSIAFRKLWTLAGGRAGKSYIFGAVRLVWGAYVRDLSTLAPGQRAVSLSVAPKDVHRQEIINYQLGVIRSRPELKATLVSPTTIIRDDSATCESFVIRRPDGHLVTFEGGTANRGGYGGRGRSLTDFLADEAAFFQDSNHVVNDKEIFKAAAPRVLPGGQSIGQTTAWAKAGFHYDEWNANYGHVVSGLSARATTVQLRPEMAEIVELERASDPDNARREFDAIPAGDLPLTFFTEADVAGCIDTSLPFPKAPDAPDAWNPETKAAGADFGFRSNSSALAMVHRSGTEIMLADLLELRPEEGKPLRPSETVEAFADRCGQHGVTYVMADGHYRESIVEHLGTIGFVDAPGTPAEACVRARSLMRDGRVRIPDPAQHPIIRRALKQLREIKGTPVAGGGYTVRFPSWPDGSHGDLAAAFILALYQMGGEEEEPAPPEYGTKEWAEEERERFRQELLDQLEDGTIRGRT